MEAGAVAYYIGRRVRRWRDTRPASSRDQGNRAVAYFYPRFQIRHEQYECCAVAAAEALALRPDGTGAVIEAGSPQEALKTLAGQYRPGVAERLLMLPHMRHRASIVFDWQGEADEGDLSGSREPRRPAPGGLSAGVALRLPDGALPDHE